MARGISAQRPEEGLLERLARRIVAEHLDVQVERFDDGTAPRQPDGLIQLADATTAPLEVVSDHDVAYNRLSDALKRQGSTIGLPADEASWYISIRHNANLKRIRELAPALLRSLPAGDLREGVVPADTWAAGQDHADQLEALATLGVAYLAAIPDHHGAIVIRTNGWSTWDDAIDMLPWIARVLEREHDVSTKLGEHGGLQRHAFIWATIGSAYAVTEALTAADAPPLDRAPGPEIDEDLLEAVFGPFDDVDEPAILGDPTLPSEITHLWIASTLSRRHAFHWSPDGGWEQTGWVTPGHEDDVAVLLGDPTSSSGTTGEPAG